MREDNGFSVSSVLLAFVLGGIVGAGITLLWAPQSGRETREKIRSFTDDIKEKAVDYSGQIKDKFKSTVEHGKEFFDEKKSLLSTAIEAGKEAYEKEKEKHPVK
jgi:gas vesicle protein